MNFTLTELSVALIFSLLVYFWWRNLTIRETALNYAKQHCKKHNLQLLDDSVAGKKWRPSWQHGQPCIIRTYQFEFTSTGSARYQGFITFIGPKVKDIWISPHHF
ncbi:DUF3301 domain-containing protein [Marinomonas epiphytica]